jgi:hypothetical protein
MKKEAPKQKLSSISLVAMTDEVNQIKVAEKEGYTRNTGTGALVGAAGGGFLGARGGHVLLKDPNYLASAEEALSKAPSVKLRAAAGWMLKHPRTTLGLGAGALGAGLGAGIGALTKSKKNQEHD